MNRRIPNGTYGGVGGRRLAASSYPIILKRDCFALARNDHRDCFALARNDNLRNDNLYVIVMKQCTKASVP
jgi:hypothetical protein